MPTITERFSEVIQYSDAERAIAGKGQTLAEQVEATMKKRREERASGKPSNLVRTMDALDTELFRELVGLCIFGREYETTDGDPREYLQCCIQNAIISPREDQSGYLEGKPIGEYLRNAELLLAQNDAYPGRK